MKINKLHLIIAAISLPIVLFAQQNGIAPKDATQATIEANKKVYSQLNFNDKQDYEDVNRGLIVPLAGLSYKNSTGQTMWDLNEYSFLNKQEAPNTINPSLYRISQLNMPAGLFKVTDHIYQVRGLDLANMTIIEGKTGIIVIDPLGSGDAGKTAINMYYDKFGKKKILAVIFTHSHGDHYGGVKGVIDEADVKSGKVQLIAPEGFLQEAISENVYAGNAMLRRGTYMYGMLLPRSEKGQVDGGLGKGTSPGFVGIMEPNVMIKKTGEKMTIDGVDIVFQMAPGTEAPSEMLFYFPQFKALCSAEDCTHTLHNLYTLRGAQVRDAKQWWKILDETNNMFGKDVEVMFGSHHWPTWGNQRVVNMLKSQRDLYKFLHDRTLNLINQ